MDQSIMAMLTMVTSNMIRKLSICSQSQYKQIHNDLRTKLQRIAFDNYYQCSKCGSHTQLEIHIPVCDPTKIDHPGFYIILCKECHKKITHP